MRQRPLPGPSPHCARRFGRARAGSLTLPISRRSETTPANICRSESGLLAADCRTPSGLS